MEENNNRRDVCWYCGGQLCWEADFNYDEVYDEGEGIVSFLHCMNCGAHVEYSYKDDAEYERNL